MTKLKEYKLGEACGTNADYEMQSVGIGKPEGKRELRRPRRRWKRQIGLNGLDWSICVIYSWVTLPLVMGPICCPETSVKKLQIYAE